LRLPGGAAAGAQISVSKWFAQFAEAERSAARKDRTAFWQQLDPTRVQCTDDECDFLLWPDRNANPGSVCFCTNWYD